MLPHSTRFNDAVYEPLARVVSRADVLSGGLVTLTGIPADADIDANRTQPVRRTASLTIPGRYLDPNGQEVTLAPTGAVGDVLAPFGNEVRVWLGFADPMPAEELLCQGTFSIWDVDVDQDNNVSVTAYDRFKLISSYRFPYPYNVTRKTSAKALIRTLLAVVPYASVTFVGDIEDATVEPQTFKADRAAAVQEIAASLGCEVFCDVWGDFVVQPIPDPYADAVITMSQSDLVITGRRTVSRDDVFNGIVAIGQSVDEVPAPSSAIAYDNDPSSPTYWFGRFGPVVGFFESSLLTTVKQADTAAKAQLRNRVGAVKSVDFTMVPHYALEPGDIVQVEIAGGTVQHLLDSVRMTTNPEDAMSAQTRAVSVLDELT